MKKPLHRRIPRARRLLKQVGEIRHAVPNRALGGAKGTRARRGPLSSAAPATPLDLAFKIGTAGVMLAAVVLGVALALAQPTWALAAALMAVGALLAAVVVFRPFSARGGAVVSS